MVKRSLRQSWRFACLAILAGFLVATSSSPLAARLVSRPGEVHVFLEDTGQTVSLPVGQKLIVTLPVRRYEDNTWYVARNSGGGLKLIAGPNELRPATWTPFDYRLQIFYFQRNSPGTVSLVLEQSYWSKPMILKVVD